MHSFNKYFRLLILQNIELEVIKVEMCGRHDWLSPIYGSLLPEKTQKPFPASCVTRWIHVIEI